MSPKSKKYGKNHKKKGEIRAIFSNRPYIRAYPYKYGRLRHTAVVTTLAHAQLLGLIPIALRWPNHTTFGAQHQLSSTPVQPRGDCFKNAGSPCRMIFWVILSLILAGFSFLKSGTDRPKCLKIDCFVWFLS